ELPCLGARLVERAAQRLEPAFEQQGPVRAPPGWRASKRGRYAFSQGKRTIRHYSEMREFAKPGRLVRGVGVGPVGVERGLWGCGGGARRSRKIPAAHTAPSATEAPPSHTPPPALCCYRLRRRAPRAAAVRRALGGVGDAELLEI